MVCYLINPHQNHALGKTFSNAITFRQTSSKLKFVFESIMESGSLGVLKTESRFPEMSRYFPKAKFFDSLDFKLWCLNKNIKVVIDSKSIDKSTREDYLVITSKDTKYSDLFTLIDGFNGTIILVLDDHLFSTYKAVNQLIVHIGASRVEILSVAPLKNNPYFINMPLAKVKETVIGWPVSQRFSATRIYEDRLNRVLALGTLTYRQFDNDLMGLLVKDRINCVHPDREYLHHNAYNAAYIDSKIPVRDYRFVGEGAIGKYLRRSLNKYVTLRYNKIDMPSLINDYRFVIYPPLFNHLPCLGMLEAMASGAILIGTSSFAYTSIGLIDGYNYISVGKFMDIEKIDDIVRSEPDNKERYSDIRKNSLRFVDKYKNYSSMKSSIINNFL